MQVFSVSKDIFSVSKDIFSVSKLIFSVRKDIFSVRKYLSAGARSNFPSCKSKGSGRCRGKCCRAARFARRPAWG
jgi:hypothetical protein